MFCTRCGQALRDGVKFCEKCGAKVLECAPESAASTKKKARTMNCGKCGVRVPDYAKFCTSCGTSVKVPNSMSTGVVGTDRPKKFAEEHKNLQAARQEGFPATIQVLKNVEPMVRKVCTEYSQAHGLLLWRLEDKWEDEDIGKAETEFHMEQEMKAGRQGKVTVKLTAKNSRVDLMVYASGSSAGGLHQAGIPDRAQFTEEEVAGLVEDACRSIA